MNLLEIIYHLTIQRLRNREKLLTLISQKNKELFA